MIPDQNLPHVVAQLETSLASPALPAKAKAAGHSLFTRLTTPVRIGIFGLPEAGKRACLNALCETTLLAPELPLSTVEILEGAHPETHAVLTDGATLTAPGYPTRDLTQLVPMFLQVHTPSEAVKGRAYLVVAADADATDMAAALSWASTRVDVAIWCSHVFSPFEQSVWNAAPDALRHHALLVGSDAGGDWARHGFQAAFDARHDGALSGYLRRMIHEAVSEDLDAAEAFLKRFDMPLSAPTPAPVAAPVKHQPVASLPDPQAQRALARLFQTLRTETRVLAQTLSETDSFTTMTAIEDLFETLAYEAEEDAISDTWPDLTAQISAARDLAVLMRLEGGATQTEDAAHLIVQVRQDIEQRFAA